MTAALTRDQADLLIRYGGSWRPADLTTRQIQSALTATPQARTA